MRYRTFKLPVLALLCALAFMPMPARAQSDERCFPETGHCISGRFRNQLWVVSNTVGGADWSPMGQQMLESSAPVWLPAL
jgi:hypothetical protein